MVDIERMKVRWEGMAGGPGVSTFYSTTAGTDHAILANFFDAIKGLIPDDVTFQVENGGDTIDPLTGTLTGAWGVGTSGPIACTSNAVYAAPVGHLVTWETNSIIGGHRLRGRTFLVPAVSTNFTSAGVVDPTDLATLQAAADAYVSTTAGSAVVWNRPKPGHAGGFSAILSARVSSKAAVLRSRRD